MPHQFSSHGDEDGGGAEQQQPGAVLRLPADGEHREHDQTYSGNQRSTKEKIDKTMTTYPRRHLILSLAVIKVIMNCDHY